MVVGGSRQETLDPGFVLLVTRQQGVPVILRKLVLPSGFGPVPPSFTVRDVTAELSEPRRTSCRTEMYSQLIGHWVMIGVMRVKFLFSADRWSIAFHSLKITGTPC
ncbi:unnamed protein product [Schistosoma curassoni]|uniref:Uncharacterized protein n=1 Tax=Schistosoma curassoni TaxID=6186 RepID=A0A183JUV9_9TREM|nr:unnamed protein product [Schistosoma curassoni]